MTPITREERHLWARDFKAFIASANRERVLAALDAGDMLDRVLRNAETMSANGGFYGDNVDRWMNNVWMARAAYRSVVAPASAERSGAAPEGQDASGPTGGDVERVREAWVAKLRADLESLIATHVTPPGAGPSFLHVFDAMAALLFLASTAPPTTPDVERP